MQSIYRKNTPTLLLLIFILCTSFQKQKFANFNKTTISNRDIQGQWATIGPHPDFKKCHPIIPEEERGYEYAADSWIIQGDTIWMYNYPCEFRSKSFFQIKSDSLYFNRSVRPYAAVKKLESGWLLEFENCIIQEFNAGTFDTTTLEQLKIDSINPNCFVGKMNIVTQFITSDEATYNQIPPIKMPKKIEIKNYEMAKELVKTKRIMLTVKGKKKTFYVWALGWKKELANEQHNSNSSFAIKQYVILTPGEWWTGEPFQVRYEKK